MTRPKASYAIEQSYFTPKVSTLTDVSRMSPYGQPPSGKPPSSLPVQENRHTDTMTTQNKALRINSDFYIKRNGIPVIAQNSEKPIALQKGTNSIAKGRLLDGKRWPFRL